MKNQANGVFCETELLAALTDISNMCVGEQAMGFKLDSQAVGEVIYSATGLNNLELNELVKRRLRESDDEVPLQGAVHTTCPKCLAKSYCKGDIENAWCGHCGDYRQSQLHIDYFKTVVEKRIAEKGTHLIRIEVHIIDRNSVGLFRVVALSEKNDATGEWERKKGCYATGHSKDFSEDFKADYTPHYIKGIRGTLVCIWTPKEPK